MFRSVMSVSCGRVSCSQQRGSVPRGHPSLPHGVSSLQRAGGPDGKDSAVVLILHEFNFNQSFKLLQ